MLGHRVARHMPQALAVTRQQFNYPAPLEQLELTPEDYVVNCIGAIPQKTPTLADYTELNARLPKDLAQTGARVIQIATDCAFSGASGAYTELDNTDASDDYGLSKIAGELRSAMNIRCSIIGPELSGKKSLFEWVKNQPVGATLNGFASHLWNGVTTDAFAKVVQGIIREGMFAPGMQHLVPADVVTKHDLITIIAERLGRNDLTILPTRTQAIDKSLDTINPEVNQALWQIAGYSSPPSVRALISSMSVE